MVPETDGPFAFHDGMPYMPWDTKNVIEGIAKYKNLSITDISKAMNQNLYMLSRIADTRN
jgi:Tat protein secretion system quality control protein TatD with DNase activity